MKIINVLCVVKHSVYKMFKKTTIQKALLSGVKMGGVMNSQIPFGMQQNLIS